VVIRFLGLKPAGEDARTFERPTRYLSFFLYNYTNSMPKSIKYSILTILFIITICYLNPAPESMKGIGIFLHIVV
jgi:hypothetical protein